MIGAIASIGSSLLGGLFGRSAAKRQAALQREFAQKGIQWRVADAKKAGIHPLAALGSPGASYTPVSGSPMGDAMADIASSIGQEAVARRQASGNKSLNAKREQLLDAEIAEARSRTLLNHANAKRTIIGPGARHDPFAMRKENALIEVKLENGSRVLVPNPDVYEIGPTELVTGRSLLEAGRGVAAARRALQPSRKTREPKSSREPKLPPRKVNPRQMRRRY